MASSPITPTVLRQPSRRMSRVLLWFILALGGAAGAMQCNRQSTAPPANTEVPAPGRRSVQRANLRADTWQLVLCAPDTALLAWAQRMVAARPLDKTLSLRDCGDYDPALPALLVGNHLPASLREALAPVMKELEVDTAEVLILNNLLSPLSTSDSVPTTITVRLGSDITSLLAALNEASTENWWSIFGGQWAYEITKQDGTLRLGSYARDEWSFASEEEIVLPAIGPPVRRVDSVSFYAVDGASTAVIDSLLPRLSSWSDSVQQLRAVYLYPSVERMGLRRGSMAVVQFDERSIHLVADALLGKSVGRPEELTFYTGMTFAHEGYRVYNGYGGSEVGPSLDSLISLRVNAVAIVPYSFMPGVDQPGDLPVPTDAGSENDAAVIYSIRQAHARRLAVLLKPQIWVRGAWPGEVTFATAAEWEQFFTAYERWITHYAEMAQAEGVAALCIGTELVHTTLEHPERWRAIISRLRKVYGGKLTYAANWGQEFENLSFWPELDAVGLNSYYPLALTTEAGDEELRQGALRWMQLADSISTLADRPLWLTEVGYRSVEAAWMNPHAEAGDRSASIGDQARCYAALLVAARESSRLQGMFVWKWPSYLGYSDRGDAEDRGFTPGGKPAAVLLQDYYQQRLGTTAE